MVVASIEYNIHITSSCYADVILVLGVSLCSQIFAAVSPFSRV